MDWAVSFTFKGRLQHVHRLIFQLKDEWKHLPIPGFDFLVVTAQLLRRKGWIIYFLKMDSTEKQLTDMMKELQSWSEAKVILEWGSFAIILFFLFVGNFVTLLVMVLNRRMRTIPNLFVASLAISDFCLGAFSAFPLCFTLLATSQWRFSDSTCQYQG